MKTRRYTVPVALAAAVLLLFVLNITEGAVHIPWKGIAAVLSGDDVKPSWLYIIVECRLPQAATAALCGASLAVSGLMLQTAFANPLAGPSVFGINSGASLGVAIVVLALHGSVAAGLLTFSGFIAIAAGAFLGAMAVIVLLLMCSRIVTGNVALLIVGIMTGYLASAAISVLNFFAADQGVTAYVMWGMGTFGGVSLSHLPVFAVSVSVCIVLSMLLVKPLNALLLGERYAENLGFGVKRTRRTLLLLTGLQTAVTTAYCGPVAFIGLAVPHITRIALSTDDHRRLMPCTVLTGAAVALLCNLVCVMPPGGTVLPLNAVTPLVGAPVIIYIVVRQGRTV